MPIGRGWKGVEPRSGGCLAAGGIRLGNQEAAEGGGPRGEINGPHPRKGYNVLPFIRTNLKEDKDLEK
jgi:hypothetical protein